MNQTGYFLPGSKSGGRISSASRGKPSRAGLVAFGAVLVSLYASVLSILVTIVWAVVTLALTFALPRLQRPGRGAPAAAVPAPQPTPAQAPDPGR